MTDATVDRLNTALEGRYAIERELGKLAEELGGETTTMTRS
jgi:hypothetical protein